VDVAISKNGSSNGNAPRVETGPNPGLTDLIKSSDSLPIVEQSCLVNTISQLPNRIQATHIMSSEAERRKPKKKKSKKKSSKKEMTMSDSSLRANELKAGAGGETSREEGASLNWHLENQPTKVPVIAPMANAVSKFARGTLMRAATSTNVDASTEDTSAWTQRAKTPATYVKTAMQQVPVDDGLLKGIRVTKVTSGGKFKARVLTISQDRLALFCTHRQLGKKASGSGGFMSSMARTLPLPLISRKGIRGFSNSDLRELYVRYLDITDIDFINVGYPCTRKLEACRHKNRLKGYEDRIDTYQDQIVSISHHGGDSIDVFIPDAGERQALVSTLQKMMQQYLEAKLFVVNEARLLRYIWYDIDKNEDGFVSDKEFASILNRINLSVPAPLKVYKSFQKEFNIKGPLTYRQCMTLLSSIKDGKYADIVSTTMEIQSMVTGNRGASAAKPMPDKVLWNQLFGEDKNYVSAKDFQTKFLHGCQKETDATIQDVKALFESINRMEVNRDESKMPMKPDCLSRFRFASYLHHVFNMAFDPDQQTLNPASLTRPITEYWINSSHNTYLMGDQLRSLSSVEMYMTALHRGCKCLELDCWDGENNAETGEPLPIIFHGGTLTGKILFEDVIECVNNYVTNHPDTYPIILSLENHCSQPYQEVMAELLKDILDDKLYVPFAEGSKEKLGENDLLPSPEQLKGRVLVKGKRPPTEDNSMSHTIVEETDFDDDDDDDKYESAFEKTGEKMDGQGNIDISMDDSKKTKKGKKKGGSHAKTVKELAELTLFHGCKHKSWDTSIAMPPSHMHSISENKITKLVNKGGASEWREYNQIHLSRTYPAGTRVDSSNYNPILAWSMGSQLVALNFQTPDAALILNDGRFCQNGKCGYVLKPEASLLGPCSPPMQIKVRILSGSCLPKPKGSKTGETIDPYLQVTVHDVVHSKDGKAESYKPTSYCTATINDNGFCPVWQEEEFHTFVVQSPHVAMIQFSLLEADVGLDDKVSDSTIPITCLRKGYRSIMMHSKNGTRSGPFGFATILAEIDY
jgi:phosphatidylinositol phospholipase C delta